MAAEASSSKAPEGQAWGRGTCLFNPLQTPSRLLENSSEAVGADLLLLLPFLPSSFPSPSDALAIDQSLSVEVPTGK